MEVLNLNLPNIPSRGPTAPPKNSKKKGAASTFGSQIWASPPEARALRPKKRRTNKDSLATTSTVEVHDVPPRPAAKDRLFPPRLSVIFQALYESFFDKDWVATIASPFLKHHQKQISLQIHGSFDS